MKRILAFGTFDHLHPGHIDYLTKASSMGDLHIVVARDVNVTKIKGRAPDQPESLRVEALQTAFPQAHVVLGDSEDYLKPVLEIAPDIIVLGYDQQLPPGVSEADLPSPVVRMEAFEPEKHKSSLRRKA